MTTAARAWRAVGYPSVYGQRDLLAVDQRPTLDAYLQT